MFSSRIGHIYIKVERLGVKNNLSEVFVTGFRHITENYIIGNCYCSNLLE